MNRRVLAEFLGTALLVMAVVGSGIMAQNMTKDIGLQLLANAVATGGALFGLITIFGPISGASFNPVVSIVDFSLRSHHRRCSLRSTLCLKFLEQ